MSIRTLSVSIAILLTANLAAADARPSDNVRYYGATRSSGTSTGSGSKTATTNSSVINASQQYKVFYQYYVHYFNWYSKRTRSQEQCRKLATLAAVRQLSIEKAAANSHANAPVQVATSLKLPGVALANSLNSEGISPTVPGGADFQPAPKPEQRQTNTLSDLKSNRSEAPGSAETSPIEISNSNAPESAETSPIGISNPNAPGSAGFQPAPKKPKRQTNPKSRSTEDNQSAPALRGPLPIAKAKESKFQSQIQEELDTPSGLRGPLPISKTASTAHSTPEQPGSRRAPDLVDLAVALQPRPTEKVQIAAPVATSPPAAGTTPASPMMQIAAAVSQQTKQEKKWWQLQLRKNKNIDQEQTKTRKPSKLTNFPTTAPAESKLVNFPLVAKTPATVPVMPPVVVTAPNKGAEITPPPAVAPAETRSTSAPLMGGVTKKTELSQVITSAPFERAWAKERYAEAKVFAAELAKSLPDSRYYAARYYVCCIQTADWTNAYTALERLVSLDQSHKEIYACDYGRILFELHKYEPAKAKLKEALAFGNDSEPVHRTLLLIAIAQNDDAAAICEYKQIARLCPRDFDSRIELAELLWKGNKKDEAVKIYDQVAAMIPDNADIQSKAGYANLVQGNYKAAMNAYKLASDSSSQQKYKNAQEFAEAQFVTVQKMASTAKATSQD